MRNEDLLSSSPPWWIDIYLYSPLWSPCPPNVPLSLPFNSVPEMRNSIEKILNRNFLLNKFHSNSTTTQPTAKKNNCQKWAPGIHPHKPHNSFLLQYKPHHQVCLDLLFDTVDSENLLGPVLTLLLQFAHTMPPPPYLLLCFPGLAASYIGGTVLDSTWNMKYASGTSWSPLRYGCLGNFTASSSHFVIAICVHHVPPLFVALFSGSRGIVHWRHCIGLYVKYEICIRYVLISSSIWLSRKFYCVQFSSLRRDFKRETFAAGRLIIWRRASSPPKFFFAHPPSPG